MVISRQQAAIYINDPKTLHEALIRNGYYAPDLRSSLMTFEFMDAVSVHDWLMAILKVRERRAWLPLMEDCRLRKLPCVPPLKALAEILVPLIEADANGNLDPAHAAQRNAMFATAARLKKYPADSDWMIALIFTLDPNNRIFEKNFVLPRKATAAVVKQADLDNSNGFFDNLPQSRNSKKGRAALGHRRMTKVEREQLRIAELESRLVKQREEVNEQIQKCQQRIRDEQYREQVEAELKAKTMSKPQSGPPNQAKMPKHPLMTSERSSPTLRQGVQMLQSQEKKTRPRRGASRSPTFSGAKEEPMQI